MTKAPKMVVEKGYFETKAEVMEDIRDSGYWPTTFISNKSSELPIHYHDHDILGYVMEGETYVLDEDGVQIQIGPGDRLVIDHGGCEHLPLGDQHPGGDHPWIGGCRWDRNGPPGLDRRPQVVSRERDLIGHPRDRGFRGVGLGTDPEGARLGDGPSDSMDLPPRKREVDKPTLS